MSPAQHDDLTTRSRAARAVWEAMPSSQRTPLRAMAIATLYGFTCGFPFLGDRVWVLGSWETWGPSTYGHPCLTLAGRCE